MRSVIGWTHSDFQSMNPLSPHKKHRGYLNLNDICPPVQVTFWWCFWFFLLFWLAISFCYTHFRTSDMKSAVKPMAKQRFLSAEVVAQWLERYKSHRFLSISSQTVTKYMAALNSAIHDRWDERKIIYSRRPYIREKRTPAEAKYFNDEALTEIGS